MSILDTIDNAIADHELSADAMRWTPEPTRALTLPRIAGPTPEQVEAIGRQLTAAFEPLARQLRQLGEAAKNANLSFAPLFAQIRRPKPNRPERVTQLRRAYRAKRGQRW